MQIETKTALSINVTWEGDNNIPAATLEKMLRSQIEYGLEIWDHDSEAVPQYWKVEITD